MIPCHLDLRKKNEGNAHAGPERKPNCFRRMFSSAISTPQQHGARQEMTPISSLVVKAIMLRIHTSILHVKVTQDITG